MSNKFKKPELPAPRNYLVKPMRARYKTQIFAHKTEPRGGAHNDERMFMEENEVAHEELDDPPLDHFCPFYLEEMPPNDFDYIRIRRHGALVDVVIPKHCKITKCSKCFETYYNVDDLEKIEAACHAMLDEKENA